MAVRMYHIAVDTHDLPSLARFWCGVLDWRILFEADDEIVIGADETALPGMCFLPVPEGKAGKNRLHLDLAPDDQAAEVERILGLGARRVDVGQGEDVTWVVLADPEGNEFCVLRPKTSLVD
ncbi:VOC family protein [Streptomyces sp. NPDC005899]|uniref:VOC family protein n=1 Tax=Streptomyces sp. NPDC005899 TaxID=3155716 RepID=UPI00340C7D50